MKSRSSGILMHISSLPGKYGIGDFGKEAYNFVDFLVKSKQKYWQILPLGVTGYGDSPYQCFSAFAGNPYFIDLDELIEKRYLNLDDINNLGLGNNPVRIDYALLYKNKMELLRIAYNRAKVNLSNELIKFYLDNNEWLRDFSLFMSLKTKYNNISCMHWDTCSRDSSSKEVLDFERSNQEEIFFWVFTQYLFLNQWLKLKKYANENGINIIGDLPIYVAEDSADVWGNPSIFKLNDSLQPVTVAGCPPDYFSETGQLWGNPIYNWEALEKQNFSWWVKRIKHSFKLFDKLRIDHFRGFESYWEVKYNSETAINGKWTIGPGIKLFNKIRDELGDLNIIAEDLGFITEDVVELIKKTGFPGMKVLQFAFDSNGESDYLPHNYDKNCVVYTGTHDNNTALGWFEEIPKDDYEFAVRYLKIDNYESLHWGLIRGAWSSTAYLAIAQMQDFIGLGKEARMNTPSTLGGNWSWRIRKGELTDELALKIAQLTSTYER